MNKPLIAKASMLSLACCALLSSCVEPDGYYGSVGVGYSNYNYGEYGYASGIYDSSGFPIFGYMGGRPVYGYNAYGSPIFSFTYIRSKCYVPSWGPAPYYRGKYHYPRGIHRVHDLPHHNRGWKAPSFDGNRPSIVNRPRPGNGQGIHHGSRPNNNLFVNNPGHQYNRPVQRPSSPVERPVNRPSLSQPRPPSSVNRPFQGGNTAIQRPQARPDRPSFGNNGNTGQRPTFNSPSREQGSRPSFNSGGHKPSREMNSRPSRENRPSINREHSSRPSVSPTKSGNGMPHTRPGGHRTII